MSEKAIKIKFSQHAINDRMDRMIKIATTIGIGSPVIEFNGNRSKYGPTSDCLTDTGVILIRTLDKTEVITMYVATVSKVLGIYKKRHMKVPSRIVQIAKQNEMKRHFLFEE